MESARSKGMWLLVMVLALALIVGTLLVGCGQSPETTPTEPEETEEPEEEAEEEAEEVDEGPQRGGTVNLALFQPPNTFIEYFSLGNQAIAPARMIYSSLMIRDINGEFAPDLATDFEISDDGMEYVFNLNPDARFHDGEPVTANDVAFTFKLLMSPEWGGSRTADVMAISGAQAYRDGEVDAVDGIEVLDDHRIKFTLGETYVPFVDRIYLLSILPEHLLGDVDIASMDESEFAMRAPVGSGPFKFKEYRTGEYLELVKNTDFYKGEPYLDSIIIKILTEEVAVAQLETGELDGNMVWSAAGISPQYVPRLEGLSNVELDIFAAQRFSKVVFNHDEDPMSDPRFRKALSYAADREGIAEAIDRGFGQPAKSPVPPGTPFFCDDAEQHVYDPDRAREILEEIGYDGETFTLLTTDAAARAQLAELLQQWWGDVGVEVEILAFDFPTQLGRVTDGEYQIAIMGWATGAIDPDYTLTHTLHSRNAAPAGWNFSRYKSDEMDELLDRARYEMDEATRMDLYCRVQQLVSADTPQIYLTFSQAVSARSTRWHNGEDSMFGRLSNSYEWWLEQ